MLQKTLGWLQMYLTDSNVRNRHRQSLVGYIYQSRPLIPDGFHLILTRFERRVSQTYPYMLSA